MRSGPTKRPTAPSARSRIISPSIPTASTRSSNATPERQRRRQYYVQSTGKVAVVTGASKGDGAAIAKTLAAHGAAMVVNYVASKEGDDQVIEAITARGGRAIAIRCDVSKAADAEAFIETPVAKYGRLDILVNSSDVYEFGPL